MSAKHTPGPWKVASYVYYATPYADKEFCITAPKRGRIAKANKLSDAILISAAPELLEALKLADMNSRELADEPWRVVVRAAIAKAEGQ